MLDVSLAQSGASVTLATSNDEDFPPENIIDGKTDTFWATTGQFPQEFVISFKSMINIAKISILCYNVLDLEIERGIQNFMDCQKWEPLVKDRFVHHEGQLTEKEFTVNMTAHHLRFVIISGHDNFACIYKVGVTTNP